MPRRTKIVCTLGPAVDSEGKIAALIESGMNVARLNCSHGDWDQRRRWIEWVRRNSPDFAPIAVLVDLQGPKFRVGNLPNPLKLQAGQEIALGPAGDMPIPQAEVLRSITTGSRLLLGDGDIELRVISQGGNAFHATVVSGGTITSRQGITVVGTTFQCDVLTPQDLNDISEACKSGADYIALSYVHCASDMTLLRQEVSKHSHDIRICAKIETRAALDNIEEIVQISDAIMVARGDLGLQMDIEEVPLAQKKIIRICRQLGKPVITATQMLESMIHAPRPTRAEATDVANAVLDGTDALMLSGETAIGNFPIQAVDYMSRV